MAEKHQKSVRPERSGFNDEQLSAFLMENGIKSYEFVGNEYFYGVSKAMIDYNYETIPQVDKGVLKYCNTRKNALPYFGAAYFYKTVTNGDMVTGFIMYKYEVKAFNEPALKILGTKDAVTMTEEEFIDFLYKVRGKMNSEYRAVGHKICGEMTRFSNKDMLNKKIMLSHRTRISRRHRAYGYDAPVSDLDGFYVNEKTGNISCFIEFKECHSTYELDRSRMFNKAIANLGDHGAGKNKIPVLLVRYQFVNGVPRFMVCDVFNNNKDIESFGITKKAYVGREFTDMIANL